jgi:O-antigen/teichoic acid export membrane protein
MTQGHRIVRNTAALLASQPVTWTLTLIFTVIVPRNVGPGEWGEWVIAGAVGNLAKALLDFGVNTVLFKGVSRYPLDSRRTLGAALMLRICLTPALTLGMIGFSWLAGYSEHTRLIVALVSLGAAASYIGTPILVGLQAFEKMHVGAITSVLSGLILTGGAIFLLKHLALGVVSICVVALAAQVVGLIVQWIVMSRTIKIRPVLDLDLVAQLFREGLPYWATFGFFTLYVWLDGVMISLMGSTQENGWYGVATQMIATLGFLPSAVTTAVFPTLARTMHVDHHEGGEVAGRSFRLVMTLSLPMSVGLAIVANNLVTAIYGGWFAPAGPALAVLAFSLVPVYLATLVNGFLIAADKQIQWTWVMGAMSVLNLLVNLVTIPYFHGHYGNAALGAALALLVTDVAIGVVAVVLLPPSVRPAIKAGVPAILASSAATVIMAAAVWPLREQFVAVPILIGVVVFTVAALALRVFPREELRLLTGLAGRLARKPWTMSRRSAATAVGGTKSATAHVTADATVSVPASAAYGVSARPSIPPAGRT